MKSMFTRSMLWVALSAVLCAVAIMTVQFYLAWIALVPLFVATLPFKPRKAFLPGMCFGMVFCAVLLYWMVGLVSDFAGSSAYGIAFYLIALLLSGSYFGAMMAGIAWLTANSRPVWLKGLLAASLWTIGEWIYSSLLPGMPWFGLFRVSNMVLDNLYAIQPASMGGAFIISFFVVWINYMLAACLAQRQWKRMVLPIGVLLVYMLAGYGLYDSSRSLKATEPLKFAILCDNTPPDVKWDEYSGNVLVTNLLNLNKEALAGKPDVILWSEAVVPWTYQYDDDFLREIRKMTGAAPVTHIIGMTTAHSAASIYNSAYVIRPDGGVSGRYDKRFPVSMAEKPMGFISLPAPGNKQRMFEEAGQCAAPIPTTKGKAGVLICNDGTVPGATVGAATGGANFLVSVSNDAWFSHVDFLVKQHFFNTRLRAVEVRKDMVINCNMGISGLVRADGSMDVAPADEIPVVRNATISPNKVLTVYARYPLWFIYVNGLFVLIFISTNIIKRSKTRLK